VKQAVYISVPGEPRRVRLEAINSTTVRVQWRPPLEREQNGVIRGYQVLYMRIGDREEGVGGTRVYDVMDGQYSDHSPLIAANLSLSCNKCRFGNFSEVSSGRRLS